ncbi:MAG: aminotransferase class I/II-fold pyridoxal phosphate-dependent enzyme [Bacteroidetes bacterium]|jgi:aspartate aminotransferase|nr:MAG: aminotransferase class I/II-fold pyridoxal phosphate-dependent enzyme [Bacteroidota bacterium]
MINTQQQSIPIVSDLAQHIIGSEIIKLNSEINQLISKGIHIYNLTIGDFDGNIFPIPELLKQEIISAYQKNQTNYPPADGILSLRQQVSALLKRKLNLDYNEDEILIAGGARPIIYTIYQTLINPGEKVIYTVPSWNNNHYTYLSRSEAIQIETLPENNFMPLAQDIEPYVKEAALVALCSPQNPTGTVFQKNQLQSIVDLVLAENQRRKKERIKPLYVMYDQIYWELVYQPYEHFNPVSINPQMRDYTIFVDGISKSLSATGVRVGWSFGPKEVISKMKSILTHIGAWAPKAEQVAVAQFMSDIKAYDSFVEHQREELYTRLKLFYNGIKHLHQMNMPIDVIEPQAALYLTVKLNLKHRMTADHLHFADADDILKYLLEKANVALVPFYAFGSNKDSEWFRLSVGTCAKEDIPEIIHRFHRVLESVKK